MEIYKNSPSEIQALIRSYYRPIHPCATMIKTEFDRIINLYDVHPCLQYVDISNVIGIFSSFLTSLVKTSPFFISLTDS